jgi:HAD superfamily phosphoserine phosphatase-like hydrolase
VVFDLDGTLIAHHEPIWKTLHEAVGSDLGRRRAVVEAARRGELTYAEWFANDLAMLRAAGATRAVLSGVLARLRPTPHAYELCARLRAGGAKVAVLSGGVDLALPIVLPGLELDHLHINRLHFDAQGALVGGEPTPYDRHHKLEGLLDLGRRFGVPLSRVAFVGDGPNDVDAARAAGFSIAWGTAPDALRYVCHRHVEGPSLAALDPLLFEPE